MSGVLKTTLRFGDSLGLTDLRKAFTFMVMVYYSERIQIKIIKGKKPAARVQERQDASKLPIVLSGVVRAVLNSPSNVV